MKREDWQRVYAPRGDALERRVQWTLRTLDERPERRIMGTTKGAVCAGLARTRGRLRAMLEEDEA